MTQTDAFYRQRPGPAATPQRRTLFSMPTTQARPALFVPWAAASSVRYPDAPAASPAVTTSAALTPKMPGGRHGAPGHVCLGGT